MGNKTSNDCTPCNIKTNDQTVDYKFKNLITEMLLSTQNGRVFSPPKETSIQTLDNELDHLYANDAKKILQKDEDPSDTVFTTEVDEILDKFADNNLLTKEDEEIVNNFSQAVNKDGFSPDRLPIFQSFTKKTKTRGTRGGKKIRERELRMKQHLARNTDDLGLRINTMEDLHTVYIKMIEAATNRGDHPSVIVKYQEQMTINKQQLDQHKIEYSIRHKL